MKTFIILCLALAACGKDGAPSASAKPEGAEGVTPEEPVVVARWKKAGLAVGPLAPAEAVAGGSCQKTDVSGVEVTLCHYADGKTAKAAEPAGLAVVGDTTGAAIAKDSDLLIVADRGGKDAQGKTIDTLTTTFR